MKIVVEIDPSELSQGINQVSYTEGAILEVPDEDEMEDLFEDEEQEDEEEDEDEEFECPPATQDPEMNAENRQYAIDEYSYGPAIKGWEQKNSKCGICEYFNVKADMMSCISSGLGLEDGVGYCERLAFVCSAENICNAYEPGGPITDYDDMDDNEAIEGGMKDVF